MPKKEVEDLLNIVNEIKKRRHKPAYYPSYYNAHPPKIDKYKAEMKSLKDKIEIKTQYNSFDKDFSIRKLR